MSSQSAVVQGAVYCVALLVAGALTWHGVLPSAVMAALLGAALPGPGMWGKNGVVPSVRPPPPTGGV